MGFKSKKFDRISEIREAVYVLHPEYYWCDVTVCESRTGKTYRVTVFGKEIPGRLQVPRTARYWIPKKDVDNDPKQAANLATHKARAVRIDCYGRMLVDRCRKLKLPAIFLSCVCDEMDKKYGKWLFINEYAQIDASSIINVFIRFWEEK